MVNGADKVVVRLKFQVPYVAPAFHGILGIVKRLHEEKIFLDKIYV